MMFIFFDLFSFSNFFFFYNEYVNLLNGEKANTCLENEKVVSERLKDAG